MPVELDIVGKSHAVLYYCLILHWSGVISPLIPHSLLSVLFSPSAVFVVFYFDTFLKTLPCCLSYLFLSYTNYRKSCTSNPKNNTARQVLWDQSNPFVMPGTTGVNLISFFSMLGAWGGTRVLARGVSGCSDTHFGFVTACHSFFPFSCWSPGLPRFNRLIPGQITTFALRLPRKAY